MQKHVLLQCSTISSKDKGTNGNRMTAFYNKMFYDVKQCFILGLLFKFYVKLTIYTYPSCVKILAVLETIYIVLDIKCTCM